MRELTELEQQILAFEKQWWRRPGAKEPALVAAFEMSATSYYLRLHRLLDNPAAAVAEPVLVKRLREARARQMRLRDPRAA